MTSPLTPRVTADAQQFVAPVSEYVFLLGEAFGHDLVAEATEGAITAEDARDVLEGAADFAASVFAPLNTIGDREGAKLVDGQVSLPEGYRSAYESFVESGWVSASAPESAGGDGLPETLTAALGEFWNGANMAFALSPALTLGAIRALQANGSAQLRELYLPKLVSGEWTGTMNLTEPQAGTDLAAVRTVAQPNDDGSWSVSGQKIYITWGDHDLADNIVHLVLARTPGAPEGHRGLSLFVVPKFIPAPDATPGERNAITTESIEHKLGIHASPTCVLQYDGATGYLLGELHGGLQAMFVMMNDARSHMGMQAIGVAQRAFDRANAYAHSRVQGAVVGREGVATIAEHPDVRRMLLSMSSRLSAMRAFAVFAAHQRDLEAEAIHQEIADFCVPILKSWTTEEAVRITSDAIQVHGGMGFIEDTGAAQHYRDARIMPIYEGTTAIQSNDLIGRKVLRNQGATVEELITRMNLTLDELSGSSNAVAVNLVERMGRAIASAQRATADLIAHAQRDPRAAFAVSVPYQELLSNLIGGWMHATVVAAVLKHDQLSEIDTLRLSEADAFGAMHLSHVHGLAETVSAGEIA